MRVPFRRSGGGYSGVCARPITLLNLEHGNPLPPVGTGPGDEEMITDRKTISIMKACELVGVSRRTIYNWIASGKVEYIRTAGGSVRIFVDTLWREPGRAGELTGKEA
jgi:excisionase family DNA binding protein